MLSCFLQLAAHHPHGAGGQGLVLRLELHGRQKDAIPNFSKRSVPAGKNVSSFAGKAAWRVGIMEGDCWGHLVRHAGLLM